LEAESSAVFSTVMGLIVGGIYPDVVLRVNLTMARQSLHRGVGLGHPPIAPQPDPRQHSAVLPNSRPPLGNSILQDPACTAQPGDVASSRDAERSVPNA
jgi:hypothetical protein